MHHDRKARRRYDSFPKSNECDFCHPDRHAARIINEFEHCYVITNRTFYTHWELRRVTDHLMITPRRHVLSLSELTSEESAEIMAVLGKYEQLGYDIFARSPQSSSRSMMHQHTHLIKAEARPARGVLFFRRPYILKLFR